MVCLDPVTQEVTLPIIETGTTKDALIKMEDFFGGDLPVIEEPPEIDAYGSDGNRYHYAPVCVELPENYKQLKGYFLIDYDRFLHEPHMERACRIVLSRHFAFLPLQQGRVREIPLEPEGLETLDFCRRVIKKKRRRIPCKEKKAFKKLVDTPASPTRLYNAVIYFSEAYDFDIPFEER